MTPPQDSPTGARSLLSRRALLAAAVAGTGALAGCPGGDGTPTGDPPDAESPPTGPDDATTVPGTTMAPDPTTARPTPGRTTTRSTTTTYEPLPTVTTVDIDRTTTPEPPDLTPSDVPQAAPRNSHHPGPPRFTSVGAPALGDLLHGDSVDAELSGVDGDLAPFGPVHGADFAWSVADAPDGSDAALEADPVVHFHPDVSGTYRLELAAPDGTHELTVRAFPEEDHSDPRPRVTLSGSLGPESDAFELDADARPAPGSDRDPGDLDVEFYVDDRDRDALEGNISADGHTATLPADAVTGSVRVHAVAVGDRHSVADYVRLHPDGTVDHPNDPPEWIRDATMYEIFVRRFGEDVTFESLQSRLDYIDSMGVDVLWLTPVLEAHSHANPFVPGGPHGYDVTDYFETADALGPRSAYEDLVAACHERDIRVVFDLVINHTAREHPYFKAGRLGERVSSEDKPFFHALYEWENNFRAQAYFGWSGIPLVDYDSLALRAWMLAVVEEWADVVDGFRCDVAWGVPRSFWKEVRDRIKADDPDFLLLDETIPWHADFAEAQFDVHFDFGFFETLRAIRRGSADATALHGVLDDRAARGYPGHTGFVNYVENHDVDRYLRGTTKEAQMAAGTATFTVPGTPMIYYGQETGLTGTRETMNWGAFDAELKAHYERLVALRDERPALAHDATFEPVELADRPDRVVAYAREAPAEGDRVVVVLNFGEESATVSLPEDVDTRDLLTGEDVAADGAVVVEHSVVLAA